MKKMIIVLLTVFAFFSCISNDDYINDYVELHNRRESSPFEYRACYRDKKIAKEIAGGVDDLQLRLVTSEGSALVSAEGKVGEFIYKVEFRNKWVISFEYYIPEYEIEKVSDSHFKIIFLEEEITPFFNHIRFFVDFRLTGSDEIYTGSARLKMEQENVFELDLNKLSERVKGRVEYIESFEILSVFYNEEDRSIGLDDHLAPRGKKIPPGNRSSRGMLCKRRRYDSPPASYHILICRFDVDNAFFTFLAGWFGFFKWAGSQAA